MLNQFKSVRVDAPKVFTGRLFYVAGITIVFALALFAAWQYQTKNTAHIKSAQIDVDFINPPAVHVAKLTDQSLSNVVAQSPSNVTQVSKNGVSAQINKVYFTAVATHSEICLQLPNNADWIPEASANVGGQKIVADDMMLVNAKDPATYAGTNRCYKFSFPGRPTGASNARISITVERIATSIPETITQADCAKAATRLLAKTQNLKFDCKNDNGRTYFDLSNKPSEMSDEQAYKLVADSFSDVVNGPWEFVTTGDETR